MKFSYLKISIRNEWFKKKLYEWKEFDMLSYTLIEQIKTLKCEIVWFKESFNQLLTVMMKDQIVYF